MNIRIIQFLRATTLAFFGLGLSTASSASGIPDWVPVEVTGKVKVQIIDHENLENSETRYIVEEKGNNRRFTLKFEGEPPRNLRSGAKVRVRGKGRGDELFLAANGSGSVEVLDLAQAAVSGEQTTLVMVADFLDAQVTCPIGNIENLMFTDPAENSIDDLYQEISYGEVWLNGQVAGPYGIDYSKDICDFSAWADAMDAAAQADGIDVAAYQRKVYVLPPNGCPAAGIGELGGSPTRAWVFQCGIADVYGHELGHNLGMQHAATPAGEYGDNTDVMGLSQNKLRQVNSAHKEQMGWLANADTPIITQSGVFDVAPLELNPLDTAMPQVLKIAKADTNELYYLSYRRKIGFDTNLSLSYVDRLSVHRYTADSSTTGKTYLLALLADGESYLDEANGITITTLGHTTDSVTVGISLSGECVPSAPTLALAPDSQTASAGTTLTYVAYITNADTATCGASTFALAAALPSNWSGTVSPNTLTLQPGETGSVALSVASEADAGSGSYGVTLNAGDALEPTHNASDTATYEVTPACTVKQPSVSLSPSSQSGEAGTTLQYSVTLTNADTAECAASTFNLSSSLQSGWTGSVSPSQITLGAGGTGSAVLSVASAAGTGTGFYSVGVQVTDGQEAAHSVTGTALYEVLPPACVAASPVVTLSPATQSGAAGATLQYSVTVTNADGANCASSTFDLGPSVPGGWSGSVVPNQLTLAAGATGSVVLAVTSANDASTGAYGIAVQVADSAEPVVHIVSAGGGYEVTQPAGDTIPPDAPTGLVAEEKRKQVNLSWNPATDNVAVISYRIFRDGAVLSETSDTAYVDRSFTAGLVHTYWVVAFDAAGNVSAASNSAILGSPTDGGDSGDGSGGGNGGGKGKPAK